MSITATLNVQTLELLVRNEKDVSVREFLSAYPPGRYTCCRFEEKNDDILLHGWSFHLSRVLPNATKEQKGVANVLIKRFIQPSKLALGMLTMLLYINEQNVTTLELHLSKHAISSSVQPLACEITTKVSRHHPEIKHSSWLKKRQPYVNPKVDEMILGVAIENDVELLEGFVTNVFVYYEDFGWCTPPLSSGILPGWIRNCLVNEVSERRILWSERHLWQDAFVTNSKRIITPIASISFESQTIVFPVTSDLGKFFKLAC